ncbi:DinB family protein [Deinococcus taeanensis]|uniref:DinB family protein n=1 Tax=Deinococcus taeanensis TaxID=2737050 RepID=UPI001CDD1164|nr:DinB family protein [Deinococcus taeanensis]UBV42257.1 DinB family protein [Deinococcus taeanensis]
MSNRNSPHPLVPALVTVATVGVAAGAAYVARVRRQEVKGLVVNRVLERPASRSSYTDLAQSLERSGTFLTGRAARAADTHANRELLAHIIGIERWGQQRLRAALGSHADQTDSYHGYRPAQDATLDELRALVTSTRAHTVDLARRLHRSAPDDALTILHNSLGPLSAKAWLRYLTQHADLESRRLRGTAASGTAPAALPSRTLSAPTTKL